MKNCIIEYIKDNYDVDCKKLKYHIKGEKIIVIVFYTTFQYVFYINRNDLRKNCIKNKINEIYE